MCFDIKYWKGEAGHVISHNVTLCIRIEQETNVYHIEGGGAIQEDPGNIFF